MSVLRKKPYIESLLDALTDEEIKRLAVVMNQEGKPENISLPLDSANALPSSAPDLVSDRIKLVAMKLNNVSFCTGILVYHSVSYCALIGIYPSDKDIIELYSLDVRKRVATPIVEKLTADELRRVLDDALESKGISEGEVSIEIVNSLPVGNAKENTLYLTDSNIASVGGTTEINSVSFSNVTLNSDNNATIVPTADQYAIMLRGNSCIVNISFTDGTSVALNRVSIEDSTVIFAGQYSTAETLQDITATFAYVDGDGYSGSVAITTMVEANGELDEETEYADLHNITVNGETYLIPEGGAGGTKLYYHRVGFGLSWGLQFVSDSSAPITNATTIYDVNGHLVGNISFYGSGMTDVVGFKMNQVGNPVFANGTPQQILCVSSAQGVYNFDFTVNTASITDTVNEL